MSSVMILTNVFFFVLYNEMCLHWEDQHNSVKHYFPIDQSMMVKKKTHRSWYPFKVQDRATDFECHRVSNVIDLILDCILQLIFKKYPLLEF